MSTLVTNKHTPADATGGAITLTLPSSPASGDEVSVEKVDTSANTVTVTGSIRGVGSSSVVLSLYRETVGFRADASSSWWPIFGHKTLTALDGRFLGAIPADAPTGTSATDSANLAAKITSAAGSTIRLRAGTYVLDNVAVTATATLQLDASTVLQHKAGTTNSMFNFTGTSLRIYGPGKIDGNQASQTTRSLTLISGNVPYGSRVVLKDVELANTIRTAYLNGFGGFASCEGCTWTGQAEHDGTFGHQTFTLCCNTGQAGVSVGTGLALAATGDTVTKSAHGLTNGAPVMLTANTAGGVSNVTVYYVTGAATNTFQLALNPGGSAVDITVDGTATVTTVQPATGFVRYNQNRHYGTITPAVAGGSPGGIFICTNGYDTTGGGAPGSDGFADGNLSTVEAIGNYFWGYGQNAGGNDIAPLHFYPATQGARVLGNIFVGCGFSAVAAKSVMDFVCSDNVVLNGQVSAQHVSSEGAISYIPGYQAGTLSRPRAVITGNIVVNPGGQSSDFLNACYRIGGNTTSLAADVEFGNNVGTGGGAGLYVNQAHNLNLHDSTLYGGTTSTTGSDNALVIANVSGDISIDNCRLSSTNGDTFRAITNVSTANVYLSNSRVTQSGANYAVDVRGTAMFKASGSVLNATGTAVVVTTDGTNNVGWLAWDATNTVQSGALNFVWGSITKATGQLAGTGSPLGTVVPGEVGTTYRQTNGTSDSVLWVSVGTSAADWVKQLNLVTGSVGQAAANGMLGWSIDPATAVTAQTAAAAGVLDVTELPLLAGGAVSKVYFHVRTAATGTLTAGQNWVLVYDAGGTLIGQADATTVFASASSASGSSVTLTAPTSAQSIGAVIRVATVWNGSGAGPQLSGVNGSGVPNMGIVTTAKNRRATAGSAITTTPPTTLPTLSAAFTMPAIAVS